MRDLNEILATSPKGQAFPNGTSHEIWAANWCDICLVDAPYRNGISGTGCPIIAAAFLGVTPTEWMETAPDSHDAYTCIEFRAPGSGGGEPRPQPKPRGQLELFGREEHEGQRTLKPLPEHQEVNA